MKNNGYSVLTHGLQPVFNAESTTLILGSFPSVKSREIAFYYGHKQNRFWKVLAAIFNEETPPDNAEKRSFILKHSLALWDVVGKCEIVGSSDASIRVIEVNDVADLIKNTSVDRVFLNGATAKKLYDKYLYGTTGIEGFLLPSTSPANAAYNIDALVKAWSVIK